MSVNELKANLKKISPKALRVIKTNKAPVVLDKKFASLVNRKSCCDVAWSIGIQNYILIGNKKKNY